MGTEPDVNFKKLIFFSGQTCDVSYSDPVCCTQYALISEVEMVKKNLHF